MNCRNEAAPAFVSWSKERTILAEEFSIGAFWMLVKKLGQIATPRGMEAEKSLGDVGQDFA
jgi:hypothetical protein